MRPCSNRLVKLKKFNKLDYAKDLADGRKLYLCKYRESRVVQCSGKGYLSPNGQFVVAKDHNHPIDDDFEVSDSDTSRTEEKEPQAEPEKVPEEVQEEVPEEEIQPMRRKSRSSSLKLEEPEEPVQKPKTTKRKHKFRVSPEVYKRAMMCKPEKYRVMRNGRWHADHFYRFGGFEGASTCDFTSVLDQTRERGEIIYNDEEELAVSPNTPSSISEASTTDMSGRTVMYERRLQRFCLEEGVFHTKGNGFQDNDESSDFTEQVQRQIGQLDPASQTRLFLRIHNIAMDNTELLKDQEEELRLKKAHLENLEAMMTIMDPKE